MRHFNKTLYIWISSILTVLFLAGTITFAWLATNRDVNHKNQNMEIDANQVLAMPISTYWIDYMDDSRIATDYYMAAGEGIRLPTYDSVFTEYNDHCNIIVRVPVVGEIISKAQPFTITITLKDMPDTTQNNYYSDETKGEIGRFLSNIVTVKNALIPSLNNANESSKQTIYDTARPVFDTINTEHDFFDSDDNKIKSLSFEISDYESSRLRIDGEDSAYMLFVYFEIAYEDSLVRDLMEHLVLFSGTDNVFEIVSDFEEFSFDVGSENGSGKI